jgi:hypothetical protein
LCQKRVRLGLSLSFPFWNNKRIKTVFAKKLSLLLQT